MKVLIGLLASLALLAPEPAEARDSRPVVKHRIYNYTVKSGSEPTRIIIQGPRWSWGATRALHRVTRRVHGLRSRNGLCSAHREAACIRVRVGWWNPRQQRRMSGGPRWMGLTIYRQRYKRVILLNRYYRTGGSYRYRVAAHEVGHALGLNHHRRRGVLGPTIAKRFSWGEVRALRRAY